jgi:hypothetical protein
VLGLLFPSWTFFDAARLTPTLQVRRFPADGSAGLWREAVMPPVRRWWHVVYNPAATQTLAAQTLVETWYRELMEHDGTATGDGAMLSLVMALAECAAMELDGLALRDGDGDGWQLRLVVTDDNDDHVTVLYESERLAMPLTRVPT